ncbi:hypothetical protein BMW26_17140 [Microbacterium sp. 1.5R]|uniref:hypothetical protein n=1 Tax=Microbacterium sp. 1.5R TaxID=1916917 RepID=UPI00090C520F|nr:hypothetical protein [Microbacterium sp. 1.5R]APH46474.1 hypothetical protein BMW26_17140 [Microbacterium sp. 1.5R]
MNAQATRRGLPAVALWGGVGAIAWATITILTGGSSASADDGSNDSLLDGVSSIVSETVSSVEDTVTSVTSPIVAPVEPVVTEVVQPVVTQVVEPVVTEVVEPVVTHVVEPVQQVAPPVVEHVAETIAQVPVVGPAASPIIDAATDTTGTVITPVTDLLDGSPVAEIVAPVQDLITELPIVGELVDDLGVPPVIDDVVGVIDATTPTVGTVVENTLPPVLEAITPARPGSSGSDPDPGPLETAPLGTVSPLADEPTRGHFSTSASRQPVIPSAGSDLPPTVSVAASEVNEPAADVEESPSAPPAGAPSAPTSSAGSSGASSFTPARLSDAGVSAFRTVERTSGASDDVLPTSLVADTDVSPD